MLTKELKWGYLAILSETDLDDWRKLNQFVEENVGEVT